MDKSSHQFVAELFNIISTARKLRAIGRVVQVYIDDEWHDGKVIGSTDEVISVELFGSSECIDMSQYDALGGYMRLYIPSRALYEVHR